MSGRLTRLITRNLPIKLAALALALMLYVAVAAQQPVTQTFTLKLTVLPPPGRALLEAPPSVSVLLSGRGSEMLRLRSLRPINLRVPDTLTAAVWSVSLKASDIDIPKGADVQVADISPRDFAIRLDSVAGKDVRIVPLVRIVAGALTGFVLTPARVAVVVRGPDAVVQRLTRDSLKVIVHLPGRLPAAGAYARLTVIVPPGIIARAVPDSVSLRKKTGRG